MAPGPARTHGLGAHRVGNRMFVRRCEVARSDIWYQRAVGVVDDVTLSAAGNDPFPVDCGENALRASTRGRRAIDAGSQLGSRSARHQAPELPQVMDVDEQLRQTL